MKSSSIALLVPRWQLAELDYCVNTLVARIVTAVSVSRINLDVVHILVDVLSGKALHTCCTNNSYIPQTEQHSPLGFMLFCLGM